MERATARELDGLNLRHLWAFCQVATQQSINRAAATMNLSQPAISHAILRLEEAFEVELFHRSSTGMRLTRMGEILLGRLMRAFTSLSATVDLADPRFPVRQGRDLDPSLLFRANQLAVLIGLSSYASVETCARELGITEKSVRRNIRNLERRLGSSVLIKDSGAVRMTRAGEAISRAGKLFYRELELALEEMSSERGSSEGLLVVGALPLARSFIVPKAMVQIATSFPQLRLRLVEGPYDTLIAAVRDGDIDVLVGALRDPLESEDVAQHLLFTEQLCVVARTDHPCFSVPLRRLADLLRYPWIAPRAGSPARRQFDELMAAAPCLPDVLLEVASHIAVRSVLLESDCLALISRHQIRYEEAQGQLAVVPIDLGHAPRQVGYTVRANWQPTPMQKRFLSELKEATAESLEPAGSSSSITR